MKQTALITGASGGIGAAIARALAPDYALVLAYRNSHAAAQELAQELSAQGCDAVAMQADLSSSKEANTLVQRAAEQWGGLDVLVNCAGSALRAQIQDTTDEALRCVMDDSFTAAFYCCRAAVPVFLRRQQGTIINISSMWGIAGSSCESAYSAAKGAIIALTKALAKELGPSGIAVNCVAPGLVDTAMNNGLTPEELAEFCAETPLGRMGTPHDVARAVRYLVDDRFTTGQVLNPNGGAII